MKFLSLVVLGAVIVAGLSSGDALASYHSDNDQPEFTKTVADAIAGQELAAELGCLACHPPRFEEQGEASGFDRDLVERLIDSTGKAEEILKGEDFYFDFRHRIDHVVFGLDTLDMLDLLAFGDAISRGGTVPDSFSDFSPDRPTR